MQIFSYAQEGYDGHIITIEVDVRNGIPSTMVVGLAGHAIQEARERVRISLKNSNFIYPDSRVVINLSPASLPKTGSSFDLAIAFSLLVHTEQIAPVDNKILLLGELHLDGTVGKVPGVISAVDEGLIQGVRTFIVPSQNHSEASILHKGNIIPIQHLSEFKDMDYNDDTPSYSSTPSSNIPCQSNVNRSTPTSKYDLNHILGHEKLKRIMEIAVSGNHHALFVGAPGSGKTLSAHVMSTLMPALTMREAIESTRMHSIAGMLPSDSDLISHAPFRTPHHSISYAAMLGGGSPIRPGEIALAHNGMLLLDEVLEFRRDVLQGLRQPLEERKIYVSRSQRSIRFPSDFLLVMTANICPCGNFGKKNSSCFCKLNDIKKYWRRLGGAFLDRVPLRCVVHTEPPSRSKELFSPNTHSVNKAHARIKTAVEIQKNRYLHSNMRRNGHLRADAISQYCVLSASQNTLMHEYLSSHQLSNRAIHITCTVARTIADLDGEASIQDHHLQEALDIRIGNKHAGAKHSHHIIDSLLG